MALEWWRAVDRMLTRFFITLDNTVMTMPWSGSNKGIEQQHNPEQAFNIHDSYFDRFCFVGQSNLKSK